MSDATQSDKKSSTREKKSSSRKKPKAEPAPAPVVAVPSTDAQALGVLPAEPAPVQSSARKRREQKAQYLTDLANELAEMKAKIEEEIESRKRLADNKGNKGIKFLKSMNKRTKKCATILNRVNKTKKNRRNGNTKSGFSIPVEISPEMSKFAGWPEGEHKSRVDVT
jgi:Tfp pilus assembly protein FimV